MRTVIILEKDKDYELFTTMTKLCKSNPLIFNYNYLKGRTDFPFKYKGYNFIKKPLK